MSAHHIVFLKKIASRCPKSLHPPIFQRCGIDDSEKKGGTRSGVCPASMTYQGLVCNLKRPGLHEYAAVWTILSGACAHQINETWKAGKATECQQNALTQNEEWRAYERFVPYAIAGVTGEVCPCLKAEHAKNEC